jgi:hypothetical protein
MSSAGIEPTIPTEESPCLRQSSHYDRQVIKHCAMKTYGGVDI